MLQSRMTMPLVSGRRSTTISLCAIHALPLRSIVIMLARATRCQEGQRKRFTTAVLATRQTSHGWGKMAARKLGSDRRMGPRGSENWHAMLDGAEDILREEGHAQL